MRKVSAVKYAVWALAICGVLYALYYNSRSGEAKIAVQTYAEQAFINMLAENVPELKAVSVQRIGETGLWRLKGKGNSASERLENVSNALEYLVAWGKIEADKYYMGEKYHGHLISYTGACVIWEYPR